MMALPFPCPGWGGDVRQRSCATFLLIRIIVYLIASNSLPP
jgi:hypothetical protein